MARTTWGPLSTDEQNQIEFAPVGEPGVLVAGTAGGLLKRNADGTIGNSILSESGSVLTAAGRLVIAGGTVTASAPLLDLSQTWNNGAVVFTGISANFTDTASSASSYIFRLQVSGADRVYANKAGTLYTSGSYTCSGGTIVLNSDVVLLRSAANTLDLRNSANAQTFQVYGTTDAGLLNYRRIRTTMTTDGAAMISAEGLGTGVSGNTLAFAIGSAASPTTVCNFTTATAAFNGNVQAASTASLMCASRGRLFSPADGQFLMVNNASTDADFFLKLGVNTSAAAGIKRVGTVLQSRLNDDSAFATIQGKLRTDNAYVAGAVVGTGYVTITDSTGTAYRVPVLV